jgi:hypothetical protein
MSSHAWRRQHGAAITAEVMADGRGAWRATVSLSSNPTVSVTTPREIDDLSSAQKKADVLARKTFDHQCDQACGPWVYQSNAPSV